MTRTLLIQRHAKSAWDTDAVWDFDRPLAKRGKRDAPRVGRWLRKQGLTPDLVVSSPALRAVQTAVKICDELGIAESSIRWEDRVYAATEGTLLKVLADVSERPRCVMLVGHNPGLEQLAHYLCGESPAPLEDAKVLPTAAVARLQMPDIWRDLQPGVAQLVSITRPREIEPD
ncbi:MAG: histidine phosphatase family protein [Pseudomonadota bacterium]|nr:histidine phosphatase family protein [Pseudomonadota bacterium]